MGRLDYTFKIGRVCFINRETNFGKLVVIVDIVDTTKAVVEGIQNKIKRHSVILKSLEILPLEMDITQTSSSSDIDKISKNDKIVEKFQKSAAFKKIDRMQRREKMNDFDRFKVMIAQKKRSEIIKKHIKNK
ncbi:60S ribosomal protein L14 [Bonamia ostreae]|uniref:60S ribosomal protein L14 n=1 Tax=Bonamia ostreae TaxID=126728 RepID=A0ABV2AE20_9EUKA